ncbi:MAG: DNA-formamidopyrimidine glycosylase family protein [Chthoniobacterales bacterium]
MPELAEVEYFRKRWDPGLGDTITAVQLHGQKRIFRGSDVRALKRRLVRRKLLHSEARGKQMLFHFSDDNWLGLHLGMSGNLRVEPAGFRAQKHDHVVLQQAKRALVFKDARLFGRVRFHHGKEAPAWWQASSPEIHAREWTKAALGQFLQRHGRAPIKAVLLLQSGFSGVGNWMADEILWRAHLSPRLPAGKLTASQLGALWRTARFVARAALATIGNEWADPPRTWLLHERWKAGGKCPRHGTVLSRATIGGRTTAWCAKCQPESASR